ncbi:hypothetical protein Tco_1451212, partial [Tanacetum coccineum]
LDLDAKISFLPLHDIEDQKKLSGDIKIFFDEQEPSELVTDQGSVEKGEKEVTTVYVALNTASTTLSTARSIPKVSTIVGRIVYSRRSAEKRKDKGKAIMIEPEPEKKSKKLLEQERLRFKEAIR